MSERIRRSAEFIRKVDEQRKRCSERNCVNWKCDGTRHFNMAGEKWGEGWNREQSE